MDVMRAVQYPLEDEDGITKMLMGMVITIVPILNFAMTGYMVTIIRNVANNEPRPLPTWDDLGGLFIRGLYVVIAQLAYGIVPATVIGVASVPLWILPLLGGENEDMAAALGGLAVVGLICVMLIGFVLGLIAWLLLLAGIIRYSVGRQELGELFDFAGNFEYLRNNIGTILMVILYLFLIGLVIGAVMMCVGLVLGLIPICGQIIAMLLGIVIGFYVVLIAAHLYGQAAQQTGLTPASPRANLM